MQATISPTTASKPCVLAAARSLRPKQQCATASLSRPAISSRGVARSTIPQRKAASRPAGRRQAMVLAAGGDALVVGSSGQTAARIVVSLLRAGVKVTAGVDTDIDESREVLNFARQVEILNKGEAGSLKLAEFNPLDADDVARAVKRGSRIVLVVGDQAGSRRPDLRVYDAVLDALLENSSRIGQLVVVTPLGGGGGTGFFGGGGRGGGGSSRLSALEQRVVDSGVSYLLVRAAPSDRVTDRYGEEANVVVEGLGGLPSGLQASRSQVAAVVAAAMGKVRGSGIIEVGASPAAPRVDLASRVAQALSGAGRQVVEEEEEEEEEEAPAKPAFFTLGSRKKQVAAPVAEEEEEEEEEVAAPVARKAPSFFGFGGKKKAAPVAEAAEEEEEEEAPAPSKKPGFSFFGGGGTRKMVRGAAAAVEEAVEAVEEAAAPAKPARRGFGFGTVRMNKQQKAAQEEQEDEEVEEAAPAKKGGFRFGTASSRSSQQTQAEEEEAPAPAPRRVIRGRRPLAPEPEQPAARAAPPARKQAGSEDAPAEKKKSGGFLGMLGIQQETVYADEP
ncbi:hypothetical protein D9Q98_000565 [Chlorella vulgaris]|uniref:NAD(P)-binding domain-containing protein n=1 Tax=Chlorella vulgaris TaxID=3077 RepID=A0A9D4TYC5_CHLVU|nr:hypothetical protein D9Q98_000565 [Chlorella vulgaris]